MVNKFFGNKERAPLDEMELRRVQTIGSAIANVDRAMFNTLPDVYALENQGIAPVAEAPADQYPAQSDNRVVQFPLNPAVVEKSPEPTNFLQDDDPNSNWLEDAA